MIAVLLREVMVAAAVVVVVVVVVVALGGCHLRAARTFGLVLRVCGCAFVHCALQANSRLIDPTAQQAIR